MQIIRNVIIVLIALAALVLVVRWEARRDAALMQAYDKYEACVEATYGMTAPQYYSANGHAPDC